MKKYYHSILATLVISLFNACSSDNQPELAEVEKGPKVESLVATLNSLETGEVTQTTKAGAGYAVNTDIDPTSKSKMTDRGWELDLKIYNGTADVYEKGQGTFTYSAPTWDTNDDIYFPNYKTQKITALFHPNGWTDGSSISTDQGDKNKLLTQDILDEKTTELKPAHILTVEMKHAHSMIDFKFDNNISYSIKVLVGENDVYTPYKVDNAKNEYLLILPTAASAPETIIQATTPGGIVYTQTVKIDKYEANVCYCFTLQGITLSLSPITIIDWATGQALQGDYVGVTEYPTFRGPADKTYYLYFDNCLKKEDGQTAKMQQITFNSRGECTLKPDGRIITHIGKTDVLADAIDLTSKIPNQKVFLSDMIVDLNHIIKLIL